MNIPKPPVAPLPPHYSPPAQRPPSSLPPLPKPPSSVPPGGATGGHGYEVGGRPRHKIVYRVATSSGTHGVPNAETLQEAIAAAQQYLAEHSQAAAQNPETAPPSATVTITASHVPQPVA